MEGPNRIKITAVNKAGIRSIPVQHIINKETFEEVRPDVYVVSIGVSDYQQDAYNLQYAAKDAGDVQNLFNEHDWRGVNYYGKIYRKILTDKQVVRDSVRAVKQLLEQAGPDDIVMVFLAGHGVLGEESTYYFAGHDMDFKNPGRHGISFGDIQYLFDGIQARKRVLFMDTCQSGELDESATDIQTDSSAIHTYGDTRIVSNLQRGVGALSASASSDKKDEFKLMKELFADFNSTGTVIISAASGTGYALENDTWKNGVFTYSIIQGLAEREADNDGNYRITVSELKEYVLKKVEILTEGQQTPTTRQENVEFDFRIW
nr:caspase family protein [Fodinibius salsisoli]